MLHGKGAVAGLGGAVKCSLWRFVKTDSNAPLDAMSYLEIATLMKKLTDINRCLTDIFKI